MGLLKECCERCRFFRETQAKPARVSTGACALHPVWLAPIARTHWCGQFKAALTKSCFRA
jgi:hypothetical protein